MLSRIKKVLFALFRKELSSHLFPRNNFVNVGFRDLNNVLLHAAERRSFLSLTDRRAHCNVRFSSAESSENLCERLNAAFDAAASSQTGHLPNGVDIRRFGGAAAVKCGFEFVWYESGYTYLYAAYSSTKYKWAGGEGRRIRRQVRPILLFPLSAAF